MFDVHTRTERKHHSISLYGRYGPRRQGETPGTMIDCALADCCIKPRDYPELKLNLRAPIELENLLPFDIQYKVFDKNTNHNWNSYLRKGGNAPVHSVDLNHLVLLSVTIQESGQ